MHNYPIHKSEYFMNALKLFGLTKNFYNDIHFHILQMLYSFTLHNECKT